MNLIPSPEEFYLQVPLYRTYQVNEVDLNEVCNIIFYTGTLDMYCSGCKNIGTFKSLVKSTVAYANYINAKSSTGSLSSFSKVDSEFETLNKTRYYRVSFSCTRECGQLVDFYIQIYNDKLSKVGQYPSLYDLNKSSIRQYEKILSPNYIDEFNKAISLASSGIGIGSFVYLRRIFESLIEEAHIKAAEADNWQEDTYQKSTVDQKINIIKEHLPAFLVENRIIYSVLSKGIHELSEKECLDNFEPLKLGIELILDERKELIERNRKIEEAKKSIQKIHEGMKGK
ncbi:hypothetical protein [Ruminiclostridium josui]|uniref:hypothetical protein n=1 Tax=Ruminiclostridium josui TaxID=1499 RepID=UPI0004664B40|nr:hypothetical protein [Ruminiclostridium josui]